MNRETKLLRIYGQVQGVGYRAAMRREAERLRVSGWVRNRRDGTVEALVCGSPEQIASLVVWAHQGPPLAVVERVVISASDMPAGAGFRVLVTE